MDNNVRILSGDFGNSHCKIALLVDEKGKVETVHYSSHVMDLGIEIDPDTPELDPSDGNGFIFRFDGRWWAVGKVAQDRGGKLVHGRNRYDTQPWKVLVAAGLLAFSPRRAERREGATVPATRIQSGIEVRLFVASPHRDAGGAYAQMITSVIGDQTYTGRRYEATAAGNEGQVTYRVTKVRTVQEAKGALYFNTLKADGSPRKIKEWDNTSGIIVLDTGGRTTDGLALLAGQEQADDSYSVDNGIILIRKRLNEALRPHPDLRKVGIDEWPDHVIDQALALADSDQHFLDFGGHTPANVTRQVEEAVEPWLSAFIDDYLVATLNGCTLYRNVILSGGGADPLRPLVAGSLDYWRDEDKFFGSLIAQQETTVHPAMHNALGALRYYLAKQNRKS